MLLFDLRLHLCTHVCYVSVNTSFLLSYLFRVARYSVAEWLACWSPEQKGLG